MKVKAVGFLPVAIAVTVTVAVAVAVITTTPDTQISASIV